MKEDIYIALLREARKELTDNPDGITLDEFKARVNPYKLKINRLRLFMDIYNNGHDVNQAGKYHMCFEAYMQLIEYEEFRHAIEESILARKEASFAMTVAVASILVSIVIGLGQLFFSVFTWTVDIRVAP